MSDGKIVGLDIGTSVIKVAIGEVDSETGQVTISGTASRKSDGLRNGSITNIESAKNAIIQTIQAAEDNAGTMVDSVITAIGGAQIESQNKSGVVPVSSTGKTNKEISVDDVERVIESATAVQLPSDREKLHVIPQSYTIDGIKGIIDPIGQMGTRLEADVHIVTASKTAIQNIRTTISRAELILDGVMLKTLAQTQSVCQEEELELGSMIIDLGAGTTDVLVVYKGAPISTASVPVGGNLITNDIAVVTGISFAQAEKIKIQDGCCFEELVTKETDKDVILPAIGGRNPEIILKSELTQIIQARMEQIFKMAKIAIVQNTENRIKFLAGNIILTGGGAKMEGAIELARKIFNSSSVRRGIPENLGGVEEDYRCPEFATVIGLILANKSLVKGGDTRRKTKVNKKTNNNGNTESVFKKLLKSLF